MKTIIGVLWVFGILNAVCGAARLYLIIHGHH